MRLDRDDGQVHVTICADQSESHGLGRAGGAVFRREEELLAVTAQGQGGVDPGEDLRSRGGSGRRCGQRRGCPLESGRYDLCGSRGW
jgi:hypothetical protein